MSYYCQTHELAFEAICITRGCQKGTRLICKDCLYEHDCPRKIKIQQFKEQLKNIVDEVGYEALTNIFSQQKYDDQWHNFIHQCVHKLNQLLIQAANLAKKITFGFHSDIISHSTIDKLYLFTQEEEESEIHDDIIEFGLSLINQKGNIHEHLQDISHKQNYILSHLNQMKYQLDHKFEKFMEEFNNQISKLTRPTQLGSFYKFYEQKILYEERDSYPVQMYPLCSDFLSLGIKGDLRLWSKYYDQPSKLIQHPHDIQPFLAQPSNTFRVIVVAAGDQFLRDRLLLIDQGHQHQILSEINLPYRVNKICIIENQCYVCDFKHSVYRYVIRNDYGQPELLLNEDIDLVQCRKPYVVTHYPLINMVAVNSTKLCLLQGREILIYHNEETTLIHTEKLEILEFILISDERICFTTQKQEIKVLQLTSKKLVASFKTDSTSIDNMIPIHDQIIAYISNKKSIIVQNVEEGSFIRIVTGVIFPLKSLSWDQNLSQLLTTDSSGRIQLWGED